VLTFAQIVRQRAMRVFFLLAGTGIWIAAAAFAFGGV
jgi:hypothetical protein